MQPVATSALRVNVAGENNCGTDGVSADLEAQKPRALGSLRGDLPESVGLCEPGFLICEVQLLQVCLWFWLVLV